MIRTDAADVVVIDDDPDLRMLTTLTFELQGWAVAAAPDGLAGIDVLHAHIDSGSDPVVLLDVQMPEIDGWEVLERVRSSPRLEGLAVVLCTVRAGDEDLARASALGADGYITKPFDIDELVAAVREVMDTPPDVRLVKRRIRGRSN